MTLFISGFSKLYFTAILMYILLDVIRFAVMFVKKIITRKYLKWVTLRENLLYNIFVNFNYLPSLVMFSNQNQVLKIRRWKYVISVIRKYFNS